VRILKTFSMLLRIVKFLGEGVIIDMGSKVRSGEKKGHVLRSSCL
jgi:hypothetical protein